MKESDYYSAIRKYYEEFAQKNLTIEVKITKGNTLPFRCLLPHQEEFMLKAERTFAYKIADAGIAKKPFDIAVLRGADPLIVAVFYRPREAEVYQIHLRNWIEERERDRKKKSITREDAARIGIRIWL